MPQLIISCNNQIVRRVKLIKPSYTIGRSSECDIVLQERTISSQHAKIINAGAECFLEDTHSTNGLCVNQQPVQKYMLVDNESVQIGKYRLTFRSAANLPTQAVAQTSEPL